MILLAWPWVMPHHEQYEIQSTNTPEIDHIVPKSRGGSNYFSNARVIS